MTKWQLARYLIEAKKNIDTLLYIKENQKLLVNIDLRARIAATCQQFYINCCIVLDKSFPKDKKRICQNEVIASIYYERDKNSAHKDENYKRQKYNTPDELIAILKNQLAEVRNLCKDFLPDNLTLDYVPHDKELFRFAYRVNPEIEKDVFTVKYPASVFHSYQLSEEGQHYFRDFDTTEQDRRIAKQFGYDYDAMIQKRKVLQSVDDIQEMSESERQRQAVIVENGLNSYEGLQNRQDFCIKMNVLFSLDMWVTPNFEFFKMIEELKSVGFLDQFEIEHLEKMSDEECFKKVQAILEKYKCKN